ncbi:hypothetical protein [Devosia sp.]|nr:hypothetical protein [Devosia sp.]
MVDEPGNIVLGMLRRMDRIEDRVDRIERRLDLVGSPQGFRE